MRRSYKQLTEGKLNRIALVTQKDKFAGIAIVGAEDSETLILNQEDIIKTSGAIFHLPEFSIVVSNKKDKDPKMRTARFFTGLRQDYEADIIVSEIPYEPHVVFFFQGIMDARQSSAVVDQPKKKEQTNIAFKY
ncbi:MAG: hypothetical protein EZS28_006926 [Streblomastix strix]|uniref:Uncharacterized protein n=1 Tax=Streblomastix strix TaxID=222440 RepID=A0A5J4WSQ5_9EUKA|nr:MAG: hypothetical protein EZS28_006926 [Streblomastix strix]